MAAGFDDGELYNIIREETTGRWFKLPEVVLHSHTHAPTHSHIHTYMPTHTHTYAHTSCMYSWQSRVKWENLA